jgi:hypothetical protein
MKMKLTASRFDQILGISEELDFVSDSSAVLTCEFLERDILGRHAFLQPASKTHSLKLKLGPTLTNLFSYGEVLDLSFNKRLF